MKRLRLSLYFALIVFIVMLISMLAVLAGVYLMGRLGVMPGDMGRIPLFYFALVSLIVGTILAFIISDKPLRPLRELMDATDRIAQGDYSVRLDLKGLEDFREMSDKFNHMAEELGSVELLRSDFINDFSHEFKTPIVSIRGFARALKWDELTEEERDEYLDIIIEESERLSDLAMNVLNMSRIEKQSLLTNRTTIDVSEQIRLTAALLESKCASKGLELVLDAPEEYIVSGNAELLKQVWINLLDNAIKFSGEKETIELAVSRAGDFVLIRVTDHGIPISETDAAHIFEKFYQADASRATHGNGLGLPLAKKIVELHGGTLRLASSTEDATTFEVALPSA